MSQHCLPDVFLHSDLHRVSAVNTDQMQTIKLFKSLHCNIFWAALCDMVNVRTDLYIRLGLLYVLWNLGWAPSPSSEGKFLFYCCGQTQRRCGWMCFIRYALCNELTAFSLAWFWALICFDRVKNWPGDCNPLLNLWALTLENRPLEALLLLH